MADVEEQEQIRPETKLQALNRALTRSWVCFLTVCYIIPVNSGILTDTGGTCDPALECSAGAYAGAGAACRFFDPGFAACQARFKTNIIAATCIASMIATFIMALVARMPLAVAPAMGVNAYFTYNVVGYLATGKVTYKQALAAVFVEGWIFIFISLIPKNIMYSTAAGIGTFLAFIGLQQAEGIGLVTYDGATLVSLGGCPPDQRYRMYAIYDGDFSYDMPPNKNPDGTINWWVWRQADDQPHTWLGIATGIIMVVLMMKDIKASILIGILFCTFISWIPLPPTSRTEAPTPGGQARFESFLKGAVVPSMYAMARLVVSLGIRAGGRTGISSFIIAIGFGISMFLSPIFASIPPCVVPLQVGALMMEHSRYVNWDDPRQAVPAFLTIVLMPLTYSIAYGIICGLSFVIFLWAADALWETVAVLSGYYKGQKTLYHVWLDTNSHEQVLIDNLPGYKSTMPFEVEPHAKVEWGTR
ncbi:putative purine permease, partial [Haematococcus lacustris]